MCGRRVICMAGKEAAEVFYDNDKFKRQGAAPAHELNTLLGQDGVQTLDGEAHDHRKSMFMRFMTDDRLKEITDLFEEERMLVLEEWEKRDIVILYEKVKKILVMAVCRWVGVPIDDKAIDNFSQELADMFESAEKIGMKHIKGKRSRKKMEDWLGKLIDAIRTGKIDISEQKPFYQ